MKPSKKELSEKWWHRLVKVTIYFFSALVCVISIAFVVTAEHSIREFKISFENGYADVIGESTPICGISTEDAERIIDRLRKRNPTIQASRPEKIFENAKVDGITFVQSFIDEIRDEGLEVFSKNIDKSPVQIFDFLKQKKPDSTNDSILCSLGRYYRTLEYKSGVKYAWDPTSLPGLLAGPLAFLLLWVIYDKIVLYIVYGK